MSDKRDTAAMMIRRPNRPLTRRRLVHQVGLERTCRTGLGSRRYRRRCAQLFMIGVGIGAWVGNALALSPLLLGVLFGCVAMVATSLVEIRRLTRA